VVEVVLLYTCIIIPSCQPCATFIASLAVMPSVGENDLTVETLLMIWVDVQTTALQAAIRRCDTPLLCYVMLCYVMLCYVMLCYVMLCYVMLCNDLLALLALALLLL
jgi:hypothetical protein